MRASSSAPAVAFLQRSLPPQTAQLKWGRNGRSVASFSRSTCTSASSSASCMMRLHAASKAAPSPVGIFHVPATSVVGSAWTKIPVSLRTVLNPGDLFLAVLCFVLHKRVLRWIFSVQNRLIRTLNKGKKRDEDLRPVEESWVGFLEPQLRVLTRLFLLLYVCKGALSILTHMGFTALNSVRGFISRVCFTMYGGYFIDAAKLFYLPEVFPDLKSDKRKAFIYNRSSSVLTWFFVALGVLQIVSSALNIPLASTLAFGGAGGIVFGLASRGVLENFFGGLMLLLSEPFVPGDMVTFRHGSELIEGRVERIGWYQTRLRGRDTRPTYVPNNVFVQNMVTNIDRVTNRLFEHEFYVSYEDASRLPGALNDAKAALKQLPKVDLLSPFRMHLVAYSDRGLKVKTVLYFATRGLDEFLHLQQLALLEITRVLGEFEIKFQVPKQELEFPVGEVGHSIADGLLDSSLGRQRRPMRSALPLPGSPPPPRNSERLPSGFQDGEVLSDESPKSGSGENKLNGTVAEFTDDSTPRSGGGASKLNGAVPEANSSRVGSDDRRNEALTGGESPV